ncbi:MAG: quinone-dependent dihydroorotate dehydrogenase [Moraxella sp.]|nr:quinone-dependent dihydroorotate dehydrogenase [Moraxella sp.]
MSYALLRPFLFMTDPERAHNLTLSLLNSASKLGLTDFVYTHQNLPTTCMGVHMPNPVGLAAGLDKNGAYIDALADLGFGFIEIGTITPQPQPGNDKPRLFRIPEAGAIINRMGFNNEGVDVLIKNVERAKYRGVLGINIGKNAVTPVARSLEDYIYCLERVYPYASYITINISSPNTKNLRELQSGDALTELLSGIKECHVQLINDYGFYVPLALKIAPDLDEWQIDEISQKLINFEIDGLIATNTSLGRVGVEDYRNSQQQGGLSGRPISHISTEVLRKFSDRLSGKVEIIGAGGIDSGDIAVNKLKAGAKAVQVYSGLIYKGPILVQSCVQAIADYEDSLARQGVDVA